MLALQSFGSHFAHGLYAGQSGGPFYPFEATDRSGAASIIASPLDIQKQLLEKDEERLFLGLDTTWLLSRLRNLSLSFLKQSSSVLTLIDEGQPVMDLLRAKRTPKLAENLSQSEADFIIIFKRVTEIESECSCLETELARIARKKSSIDSTLMPPPETQRKDKSREDPDRNSTATIRCFRSRAKSRNNSAESKELMTSGETSQSAADEARTSGPDKNSRGPCFACGRSRDFVEHLQCLWEKVEGAARDVFLGGG